MLCICIFYTVLINGNVLYYFPRLPSVLKDPPYVLSATAFGSSEVLIEVQFRKFCGTRKVQFSYDLFLPGPDAPPVRSSRTETLTFCNPCDELQDVLQRKCSGV